VESFANISKIPCSKQFNLCLMWALLEGWKHLTLPPWSICPLDGSHGSVWFIISLLLFRSSLDQLGECKHIHSYPVFPLFFNLFIMVLIVVLVEHVKQLWSIHRNSFIFLDFLFYPLLDCLILIALLPHGSFLIIADIVWQIL